MKKNLLMVAVLVAGFVGGSLEASHHGNWVYNRTGVPVNLSDNQHGIVNGGGVYADAPVNHGVGPVITGASSAGFIPAAVEKKYARALKKGKVSCNSVNGVPAMCNKLDGNQKAAYAQAVEDLQKYYGFTHDQASCYACIYARNLKF